MVCTHEGGQFRQHEYEGALLFDKKLFLIVSHVCQALLSPLWGVPFIHPKISFLLFYSMSHRFVARSLSSFTGFPGSSGQHVPAKAGGAPRGGSRGSAHGSDGSLDVNQIWSFFGGVGYDSRASSCHNTLRNTPSATLADDGFFCAATLRVAHVSPLRDLSVVCRGATATVPAEGLIEMRMRPTSRLNPSLSLCATCTL